MKCLRCGSELEEGVKFCPQCGAPVAEAAQGRGRGEDIRPPAGSKKTLLLVLLALGVGISAFLLVLFLGAAKPEMVAQEFFRAIKEENWEKAYSFLYFAEPKEGFYGIEEFKKTQEAIKARDGAISGFQVGPASAATLGNGTAQKDAYSANLQVKLTRGTKEEVVPLEVVKAGGRLKINAASFLEERRVITYPGIKVGIQGKDYGPYEKPITFMTFRGCPITVTFSHDRIKAKAVTSQDQRLEVYNFDVADGLRQNLMAFFDSYRKAAHKAIKELDASYYRPYLPDEPLIEQGLSYKKFAEAIEERKAAGYYQDVTYFEISYGPAAFLGGLDKVELQATYTQKWVALDLKTNWPIQTFGPKTFSARLAFVFKDDRWYLARLISETK